MNSSDLSPPVPTCPRNKSEHVYHDLFPLRPTTPTGVGRNRSRGEVKRNSSNNRAREQVSDPPTGHHHPVVAMCNHYRRTMQPTSRQDDLAGRTGIAPEHSKAQQPVALRPPSVPEPAFNPLHNRARHKTAGQSTCPTAHTMCYVKLRGLAGTFDRGCGQAGGAVRGCSFPSGFLLVRPGGSWTIPILEAKDRHDG